MCNNLIYFVPLSVKKITLIKSFSCAPSTSSGNSAASYCFHIHFHVAFFHVIIARNLLLRPPSVLFTLPTTITLFLFLQHAIQRYFCSLSYSALFSHLLIFLSFLFHFFFLLLSLMHRSVLQY